MNAPAMAYPWMVNYSTKRTRCGKRHCAQSESYVMTTKPQGLQQLKCYDPSCSCQQHGPELLFKGEPVAKDIGYAPAHHVDVLQKRRAAYIDSAAEDYLRILLTTIHVADHGKAQLREIFNNCAELAYSTAAAMWDQRLSATITG